MCGTDDDDGDGRGGGVAVFSSFPTDAFCDVLLTLHFLMTSVFPPPSRRNQGELFYFHLVNVEQVIMV